MFCTVVDRSDEERWLDPPEPPAFYDCYYCGDRLTKGRPAYRLNGEVVCSRCFEHYQESEAVDMMRTAKDGEDLFCIDCDRDINPSETYYADGSDCYCEACFEKKQKKERQEAFFEVGY